MTRCSLGADTDIKEGLKNEVEALKARCDALEKTVVVLKSICDTHQNTLETWRQRILISQRNQGTLDSSYNREEYELMS